MSTRTKPDLIGWRRDLHFFGRGYVIACVFLTTMAGFTRVIGWLS